VRGIRAKAIRNHSKTLLVSWLHTLLDKEEADKINIHNYMDHMPKQTHLFIEGQLRLSAFHPKWVVRKIKRLLKEDPDLNLKDIDLELIKWIANRSQG
tara:strand:- start:15471 stop:15764 length:294 start_codon:yes stop_codon:yes gene_type:complete